MNPSVPRYAARPILAVLLPVGACYLQWLGWSVIHPFVWFLFYPVIFFSSWIGGFRAGLAATALSAGLGWWYFMAPVHVLLKPNPVLYLNAAIFMFMGVLFSHFHDQLHRANRKAAMALEAETQATFQQAAIGIAHLGLDGSWLRVNRRFCEILGYTREELLLLPYRAVAHPDDLEADRARLRNMQEPGQPRQVVEKRFLRKDGSVGWMTLGLSLVRNARGLPDYFIAVVGDISARKAAEAKVRERDDLLDRTSRMAKVGGWEFDAATFRGAWSDEVARIHDLDPSLPVDVASGLGYYHEEDRPIIAEAVRRAVEEARPFDLELRFVSAKGIAKWVHTIGSPILEDGRVVKVHGALQDTTERKGMELALRDSNATLERRVLERTAELQAATAEMESFAYAVSHDLRAPLRAMGGFGQALLEDCGDRLSPEGREDLDHIIAASLRMGRLIDGLLDLSRAGRGDMARVPVALSAMMARELAELARADPDREVQVRVEPGIRVQGDPRMLEAVLGNLLGNAWKYTSKTAGARIAVDTVLEGGRRWIRIADNGCGFDMAFADKLFKPFQRLHRQDEFPGLGIGLATVHRIVQRHGGELKATSAPGRGASFLLFLPMPEPQEES